MPTCVIEQDIPGVVKTIEPFLREAGTGPGVVCIHANASTSAQWRGLMDLLAPRFLALPFNPRLLCVRKEAAQRARAGALYQLAPGYVTCAIPQFAADGSAYSVTDCFDFDVLSK